MKKSTDDAEKNDVKVVSKSSPSKSKNPFKKVFAPLILFIKQIIDELKRVVYPTQKEVRTYSAVVIVFLVIVTAFITLIDATGGKMIMVLFESATSS
jgi:preprotein translocase subunit SecE